MKEVLDALKSLVEVADLAADHANLNVMDDAIAKARAVLAKMETTRDENGWYPMATAPKHNAKPIDLWHKRGYRAADCHWSNARKRHGGVVETGWTERDGSTNPESDYVAWRPQPKPPLISDTPKDHPLTNYQVVVNGREEKIIHLGRDELIRQLAFHIDCIEAIDALSEQLNSELRGFRTGQAPVV